VQLEGPKGICEMLNELAQPFAEKHKDRKSTSLGDQFDNCLILVESRNGASEDHVFVIGQCRIPYYRGTERCC
jgi:hypothetical protein